MKSFLFTLSLIVVSATAIISLCSWDYAPLEPASHNSANITAEDDWILIGEVTLSKYNGIGKIKANLYVREIAKKLIYRVEYQGAYYSTRWAENIKTYLVTINENSYICDVPITSSDSETTNSPSSKYVGKWKRPYGNSWSVDIRYNDGRYGFILNPSAYDDITEIQELSNSLIFTYVSKFDHRSDLSKKGWQYYVDDRDNNADSGYPTSGQYHYDRTVCHYTISISLEGDSPVYKCIKMHSYYYLNGYLTYAETETEGLLFRKQEMIKY